jgi:hypothetical protein
MLGVVVGITAMAWSVSAEREHRYKMPEVCLSSIVWCMSGFRAKKLEADTSNNSLTDSHLRDTGRDRFGSTRLHRRRLVARDPLRKIQSCEGSMWNYGVYGLQREKRLWERHLYICEEANRQVPPILPLLMVSRIRMVQLGPRYSICCICNGATENY